MLSDVIRCTFFHGWRLLLQDGTKVAETSLKVTSPFRLGLVRHPAEKRSHASFLHWCFDMLWLYAIVCHCMPLYAIICYQHNDISSVWIEIDLIEMYPSVKRTWARQTSLHSKFDRRPFLCSVCLQMFVNEALNHAVFYYEAGSYQDIETNMTNKYKWYQLKCSTILRVSSSDFARKHFGICIILNIGAGHFRLVRQSKERTTRQ